MFTILMKERSAENVIQAYLFGIHAHKDGSVTILSYNDTELKNKVLNEYITNWVLKCYFLICSICKVMHG